MKAYEKLPSRLRLNITSALRYIHGPKKALESFGRPGAIEKIAKSGLNVSKLAYVGVDDPQNSC